MFILVVEPQKEPQIKEITDDLQEMQAIVGGLIQIMYPFPEEVALVCNDEGKLLGLPLNRGLRDENGNLYDIVSGTFFLCGAPVDSDSFTSLTLEQIEKFERRFRTPEIFISTAEQIVAIPVE